MSAPSSVCFDSDLACETAHTPCRSVLVDVVEGPVPSVISSSPGVAVACPVDRLGTVIPEADSPGLADLPPGLSLTIAGRVDDSSHRDVTA